MSGSYAQNNGLGFWIQNPTASTAVTVGLPTAIWTSNGYVGVGNSNPQYALDVLGTGNFSTSVLAPNITSLSNLAIGDSNVAYASSNALYGTVAPNAASALSISTAASNTLYGTVQPLGVSTSNVLYGTVGPNASNALGIATAASNQAFDTWLFSGTNLYTANANYNVGIGTSTPAFGLDVSDYAHAYALQTGGGPSATNSRKTQVIYDTVTNNPMFIKLAEVSATQNYTVQVKGVVTSTHDVPDSTEIDVVIDQNNYNNPPVQRITESISGHNFFADPVFDIVALNSSNAGGVSFTHIYARQNCQYFSCILDVYATVYSGSAPVLFEHTFFPAPYTSTPAALAGLDSQLNGNATWNYCTYSNAVVSEMVSGSSNTAMWGWANSNPQYKYDFAGGDLNLSGGQFRSNGVDYRQAAIGWETSNGSIVTFPGSNVGIGTTTPSYPLDVHVASHFSSGITVDGGTANLALAASNGQQVVGGCSNGQQNAASIVMSGRSYPSTGGSMNLVCCDNGFLAFDTLTSAGAMTEYARMTGSGQFGIGTTNPTHTLHVNGSFFANSMACSSNVASSAGILGPLIKINDAEARILSTGTIWQVNSEYGNPSWSCFSSNGFGGGTDNTGLGLSWNKAYLLFRGCVQGTNTTPSTCTMVVQGMTGSSWTNLTSTFSVTDRGSTYGYATNTSPIFSVTGYNSGLALALYCSAPASTNYILGNVYLQLMT